MFDALRFYQDHGIEYVETGHKHCRTGWVQIECPFCTGNPGYHLGFCINPEDRLAGAFVCWRCKGKGPLDVVQKLLGVNKKQARQVFRRYKGRLRRMNYSKGERIALPRTPTPIDLPAGWRPLVEVPGAVKYLRDRGYKPARLAEKWGVCACGHLGKYKHRVLVPITYQGVLVSYQGRDYTGKSEIKYKACEAKQESVHHKDIVGGFDQAIAAGVEHGVFVEGFFDVFPLGPGAMSLFGIGFRMPQITLIAKHFKGASIVFDGGEQQARIASWKICAELAQRGLTVQEVILSHGDIEEQSKRDRKFIRNLIK